MGKPSKRIKKSRAELLARKQQVQDIVNTPTPTSTDNNVTVSSVVFDKVIPIIIQFLITWVVIVGGMKTLTEFGVLPDHKVQVRESDYVVHVPMVTNIDVNGSTASRDFEDSIHTSAEYNSNDFTNVVSRSTKHSFVAPMQAPTSDHVLQVPSSHHDDYGDDEIEDNDLKQEKDATTHNEKADESIPICSSSIANASTYDKNITIEFTDHTDTNANTIILSQNPNNPFQQQQQNGKLHNHQSPIGYKSEYPNLMNITPELQKQFHPVVKFPTKTVYEEELDAHATPSAKNKMKKIKKKMYRLIDFTTTSGSSQLIHPSDQTKFRKERNKKMKKRKKNLFQLIGSKLFSNHSGDSNDDDHLPFSVAKYDENRQNLYSSELFQNHENDIDGYDGARTVHMGIDLGGPVGTKVYSFWNGIVHSLGYNPEFGDYGYVIVVQYAIPFSSSKKPNPITNTTTQSQNVWALYGHLDKSIMKKKVGQKVKRGQVLGRLGDVHENGGWSEPHVHFQLSLIEPETHDMPGAVAVKDRSKALLQYPDPRYIVGPLH